MATTSKRKPATSRTGKLRIGDDWSAINIIALSQSNPLKAVAEFVENSIDAGAKNITITRGRQRGEAYLKIIDDGDGIPLDDEGKPNFKYVATHICDSIKRQMKADGKEGIQGEFGIGLLSFWTVGERLSLISTGSDGHAYQMRMAKGDPTYEVSRSRRLLKESGVELTISPLLPGIRHFSGEKLDWYLSSELRDRIRLSEVKITIIDRQSKTQHTVEPRAFTGQLLHHLPPVSTPFGEAYVELYLADSDTANCVSLYRSGTRVLENITDLYELRREPWMGKLVQGVLDAPFLNITPGSRSGVVHDDRLEALLEGLKTLEIEVSETILRQQQAADEQANRNTLQSIQRAFREALLALPEEEYDWFEIRGGGKRLKKPHGNGQPMPEADAPEAEPPAEPEKPQVQREFFEHAGPLHNVRISPATCALAVSKTKSFRAVVRDRAGRQVEDNLIYQWTITEGQGQFDDGDQEIVKFIAPEEPQLAKLALRVTQDDREATAEALITVTDSLLPESPKSDTKRGLPEYTFEKHPGELWRSRYDLEQNVIVVNNGHRDFVYASKNRKLKLRYICRLFIKELVCQNFPGYSTDQLLERMIELSLYTEENLR